MRIYRNRRGGYKKPFKKSFTPLAKKVSKLTKIVMAQKPELKYSWNYSNPTINNAPTAGIFPYRSITVGTGDLNNRIGDNISVKKFTMRGWLDLPAGSNGQIVRFIAFIYKRNPDAITTAFPTIINLYLESTTMNTVYSPLAYTDWDNHSGFATLADKRVVINPTTSDKGTKMNFDMTLSIPKAYQEVEYSNGGVYPTSNELIIAFIGDNDDIVSYTHSYRFTYTDA